jgi:hypothetical protein
MHVEGVASNKWQAASGIWIEQFATPASPDGVSDPQYATSVETPGIAMEHTIEQKYNVAVTAVADPTAALVASPNVTTIFMVCRAIKGPSESANSELMYACLDGLKASPIVDPKGTQVGEKLITDDSQYTFTFAVKVALKNPLKF